MRIIEMEIHNFRGIRSCKIHFSEDDGLICLIGAGDSTKSTILLAIEWLFYKSWNLPVCDNDFFDGETRNNIIIRGTFIEFPKEFMAEDKFGMYLRRPGVPYDSVSNDEPTDDTSICLTMQLTIDSSLEPRWEVVCNRGEAKHISNRDRSKLPIGCVGNDCAKDLVWGRYSVLQKYADAKGVLHDAYTKVLREASDKVDLSQLDAFVGDIAGIGSEFGVGFENDIKNKLMIYNGSFSSSAGLYDGSVPLNLRGLGSQRLLSMGLNITASQDGTVLLVDEVENGLEPYRLRSLINKLRALTDSAGQVILTTHSPVVLTECRASELCIVNSNQGLTEVYTLDDSDKDVYTQMQAQIRSDADAFLSKALIVCEGKTECGFIKALDDYVDQTFGYRLAYKGIGTAMGGGENTFKYAKTFRDCGYTISIFMDSDKVEEKSKKDNYRIKEGIQIFDWDEPNSIEQQLFMDLPETLTQKLLDIAVDEKGSETIKSALNTKNIRYHENDGQIVLEDFSNQTRLALGELAKRKSKKGKVGEWYKRIDLGRLVGDVVFENWSEISQSTKLYQTVQSLLEWVNEI